MDNKKIACAVMFAAMMIARCGAQDNDINVACSSAPHLIVDWSNGRCPPTPGNINYQLIQGPNVQQASNCLYITVWFPYTSGKIVTSSHASLTDPVECIPYFWGQWWNTWFGNLPQDPNNPIVLGPGDNGGMDGTIIHATIDYPGQPLENNLATAQLLCTLYGLGEILPSDTTTATVIGDVPIWSCPCIVTEGQNCPDGLWAGLYGPGPGANPNLWGTIYATGPIFPDSFQSVTFWESVTLIVPPCTTNYVHLNVEGVALAFDPDLQLSGEPPGTWQSANTNMYIGAPINQFNQAYGTTTLSVDKFGDTWVNLLFNVIANADTNYDFPTLPPAPSLAEQIASAVASQGPGVLTQPMGMIPTYPPPFSTPSYGPGRRSFVLPPSFGCTQYIYDWPGPAANMDIRGTVCTICAPSANQEVVNITWCTQNLTDVQVIASDPILTPFIPTPCPPNGSASATVDLQQAALNQPKILVTLSGIDPQGAPHTMSRYLMEGTGVPTVTPTSTNLTIVGQLATASWGQTITTTGDPTQVSATVYQNTNWDYSQTPPVQIPTPLTNQTLLSVNNVINTPASNCVITAQTTVAGEMTLFITAPCGVYSNVVQMPLLPPPLIFATYGAPNIVGAPFTEFGPSLQAFGPINYTISNMNYSATNPNSPPCGYILYGEPYYNSVGCDARLANFPDFTIAPYETGPAGKQAYGDAQYPGPTPDRYIVQQGTFMGPSFTFTTLNSATELTAWTVQPDPGTYCPTTTNDMIRIGVETPFITSMPFRLFLMAPTIQSVSTILHNDITINVTNFVTHDDGTYGELIFLAALYPMNPTASSSLFAYPGDGSSIPLNPDALDTAGVVSIYLSGNNMSAADLTTTNTTPPEWPTPLQWFDSFTTNKLGDPIGFWQDELQNFTLGDNWYACFDELVPPPFGPQNMDCGVSQATAMFTVGDIAIQINGTTVTASTITTNAILSIMQQINGLWVTNAAPITLNPIPVGQAPGIPTTEQTYTSHPPPPPFPQQFDDATLYYAQTETNSQVTELAAAAVSFQNVDLGYPTRIVATRMYYNPAVTNLSPVVIFTIDTNACQPVITINHTVTNLFVESQNPDGTFTYVTNVLAPYSGATTNITMTESNGTYLVFAQTSIGPLLNQGVTIVNSSAYSLSIQGGSLLPEASPNQYLLTVTNSPVTLSLNGASPNETLSGIAPWANLTATSLRLDASLTNSMSFTTTSQIATPCSTNLLLLDIVITAYNKPPFDIPVSTPSTNTCTNLIGGGTISQ
jgi:hypothetical protein